MAIKTGKDVYDDFIAKQSAEARRYGANNPLNESIPRNSNKLLNFLGDVYTDNEYQGRASEVEGKYKRNKELHNPNSDFYRDGGGSNRQGVHDFRYGIDLFGEETGRGHEDPTILGFDLVINTTTSPLFSGSEAPASLGKFYETFSTGANEIKEVAEKVTLYREFIGRIGNYFQKVGSSSDLAGETVNFSTDGKMSNFKSHYIKSVSGLHNLTEKIHRYGGGTKQTHGNKEGWEDGKITLKLYEDVELSSGYLAMLYKTMTWSRLNQKQLIPDNLLRFDMDIVISEIRNFNKVVGTLQDSEANEQAVLNVVADNVSRYVYRLYECQFIFDNLSNQDEVDNWSSTAVGGGTNDLTVDIIYKFSTVDMEKMDYKKLESDFRNYVSNRALAIENDQVGKDGIPTININTESFQTGDGIPRSGTLVQNRASTPFRVYPVGTNQEAMASDDENSKSGLEKLKSDSAKFAKKKATRKVNDLVNDSIGKIRKASGLRGISAPQNVYTSNPDSLQGFVIGQVTDFGNDGFDDLLGGLNNSI